LTLVDRIVKIVRNKTPVDTDKFKCARQLAFWIRNASLEL